MKAIIKLDVPEWQIGQDVTVHFPDTMVKFEKCEMLKEQEAVVRCKDCKHRPTQKKCFPDMVCPCQCSDSYYSWVPPDDWYCADGERNGGDGE